MKGKLESIPYNIKGQVFELVPMGEYEGVHPKNPTIERKVRIEHSQKGGANYGI